LFNEAIAEFKLPDGFTILIDPWPYGGPDPGEQAPRYLQGLIFARDNRSGNEDSNHYAYPIPIVPILDTTIQKIIRIDKLATGGKKDGITYNTQSANVIDHCVPAEYVPELLGKPLRTDIQPLNVVQPKGPSFKVSDESLVEWQKWSFRVGFNHREGATIHNVRYDGRSVLYRLSISEMTVPYGDPRPPFHRKQAFDFGDAGAGRAANNLSLGCDCLGVIKYFDALLTEADGSSSVSENVVCLHEQDNGIGWKHTNFRTQRAVVTRSRELVVQFIITLANYEYIFAYKFDQAGGITVETRATGIVSVVNIDPGKTSQWGNVVSPGVMAQNHQHIFCIRIDPAIDGHANTIVNEESLPMEMSKDINPFGNGYEVRQTPITKSSFLDASPWTNRTIKMTNPSSINPISQKPVSYKFIPEATQLLLAHPDSIQSKRAQFAQHHVWVTKYKEGELWAGGEFTNQSQREIDGLGDAVARNDDVENTDVVVWNVFGLTHNPRVEDWPVMPVEVHQLHLKPADFFTCNPAIDVPGNKNMASILTNGAANSTKNGPTPESCCENGEEQGTPAAHLQGTGEIDPKDL
jgi:primary-amine oxidase